MVYALRTGSTLLSHHCPLLPRTFCRFKSITQAIEQGRRRTSDRHTRTPPLDGDARSRREDGQQFDDRWGREEDEYPSRDSDWPTPFSTLRASRARSIRFDPVKTPRSSTDYVPSIHRRKEDRRIKRGVDEGIVRHVTSVMTDRDPDGRYYPQVDRPIESGPESLPFTTAASEFIYGLSSILAAVKAKRRKLYKLYVHSRRGVRNGFMAHARRHRLFDIITEVGDEYLRAMDKASSGRPHNGLILEASPLPVPPIVSLRTPNRDDETYGVVLDSQSTEEINVNGTKGEFSYNSEGWRYPFVLFVDGVVDEGNLGAIARSAYLLGVDAIVTFAHNTAPWSHIAVKASAGAAEAVPIFKVGTSHDFLRKSMEKGWKTYASDALPPVSGAWRKARRAEASRIVYTETENNLQLDVDHCPVAEHPTILLMGSEANGLKPSLLGLADYKVGIPHRRSVVEIGVDSLNVSVAASLLCHEMLQRPRESKNEAPQALLF